MAVLPPSLNFSRYIVLSVLFRRSFVRLRPDGVAAVGEAMDAGGIGRQRDFVARAQIELADIARRERPDRAGIDIEEGIAAEMFGGHHGPPPALPFPIDLEMLGPHADGRSTP